MTIREPLDPKGCPSAIAPPSRFTICGSTPSSRMLARDWLAKASLISMAPSSLIFSPARSRTLLVAGTGPIPMISGSSPADCPSIIRARAFKEYFFNARSETTRMAEAPSLSEDAFPAVTTSPPRTTGRRPESTSILVPGRGPSSVSTMVSPFRCLTVTGTISSLKCPASMAAMALA